MGNTCTQGTCPSGTVSDLIAGAARGDMQLCLAILKDRPDFATKSPLSGVGNTAIHAAVAHVDLLEAVIDLMQAESEAAAAAQCAAAASTSSGACGSKAAAGGAQLCRVQQCLSRVLDMTNSHGQTPLMLACRGGHPEAVRLLLLKGADPWLVDRHGSRTALHHAALAGHDVCIKALLTTVRKTSRYIDTRTVCGFSPLHCAVAVGSLPAVRSLLVHTPNLYACNVFPPPHFRIQCPMQTTVLHMAAIAGNYDIVKELLKFYLERSAIVTMNDPRRLQDGEHQLPHQVATARGHHHLVQLLQPTQRLLGEVFRPDELRVVPGFPPLRLLAAAALRARLLASLDKLSACAAAAAATCPVGRLTASIACPGGRRTTDSTPTMSPLFGSPVDGRIVPSPVSGTLVYPRRESLQLMRAAFEADDEKDEADDSIEEGDEEELDQEPVSPSHVGVAAAEAAPLMASGGGGGRCGGGGGFADEPAAVSAPRGGGDRAEACGICLDYNQSVAIAGCGHEMCRRCARSLARQVHDRISPCPFCRRPIDDFVAIKGVQACGSQPRGCA